jgi:hypothetical protein
MPAHCLRLTDMENMMNRIKNFLAISAFSLLILGLPAIASAQWGGNNGGYVNGRYNRDIRGTLQNLKNRANSFERLTNRIEDRDDDDRWGNRNGGWGNRNGGWGNNRNGDVGRLEDLADRFKDATKDLLDEYGRGRDLSNSDDEARRVLDIASQIDNEIYQTRGNRNLQSQWNQMRNDLNVVASVYGNSGYNNGNRNRNGGWRNRFPFPF